MIELAPAQKRGLTLSNPILLAAGAVGMGEATHAELDLAAFGALVAGPLTRKSRAGSATPRIAETPGGILLETGGQNRGLDATLKHHASAWARLPTPVIVQLVESDARTLGELASRLAGVEGVAALEWMPPPQLEARNLRAALEALQMESDLPLLLRPPLARVLEWGALAVQAGVSALVVGAPPRGASARPPSPWEAAGAGEGASQIVQGALFGPAVFPLMLAALLEAAQASLGIPLVASGGIFGIEQARASLQAGAAAVQLDAIAWLEPAAASEIARQFAP